MWKKIVGMFVCILFLVIASTAIVNADFIKYPKEDGPPLVVIQSPENGTTFNSPYIVVKGYATDDIGLIAMGQQHEWIDGDNKYSFSISQTTNKTFFNTWILYEGWNRITYFVYDTVLHYEEDQIVVYYVVSNQPPNKPLINGSYTGKPGSVYSCSFIAEDPEGDDIFYEIDWGDGNVDPWSGPINSNEKISRTHKYLDRGEYTIMARAKDIYGNIGDWGKLIISMPKTYFNNPYIQIIMKLLECFSFS